MKNSLLIYSGGMDSTVLLYKHIQDIKLCVSFNYGSKHNNKEIEFAKHHTAKFGTEHIIVNLSQVLPQVLKSNLLTGQGEIPDGHYEDISMKKTVVPFRNGIMLSIAAGIAESNNLKYLMIANHAGDHAIYPDCRATFIDSMNNAIAYGTYNNIQINAPFTNIDKRQVALIGKELGVDFTKTWSCYKGQEKHCGKCGTCTERIEALKGFDKTNYDAV